MKSMKNALCAANDELHPLPDLARAARSRFWIQAPENLLMHIIDDIHTLINKSKGI